ncbi:pyridoxamine 5'-phosphate oxidase family protein [Muriicola sp.]|uniref:pyridoxamine 5'-phosphate oxidase family protein n=1 Tax=Muriicola sp. TaxID=2020856 RepID=UPI003C73F5A2
MGKQLHKLTVSLQDFIAEQKIFFVATAMSEGRINLSPKGIDTFRVLDEKKICWLNLTGSGNETATHVLHNNRMTILFCAFEGAPKIVRLYGTANVFHPGDPNFGALSSLFPEIPGTRQIFEMSVELVQISCGMGVPLMAFEGNRKELIEWAKGQGEEGLEAYRNKKNSISLDGLPTGIQKG